MKHAFRTKIVNQHWCYKVTSNGKSYTRGLQDMNNQNYAAWLYAIAGTRAQELNSTNRERLGDMVENGLTICMIVDQYTTDFGWLLRDPNGMWGRMETSIRLSIEQDLQRHFKFSVRQIPKAKTHRWTGVCEPEVMVAFHELQHPVVTVKNILGPGQERFKTALLKETDVEMEQRPDFTAVDIVDTPLLSLVCTQCESGKLTAICDCTSAIAYRSVTTLLSRKRSRRADCEETFAKINDFITAKRQQMNSSDWEESPSSPTASNEPSGVAGGIPASPGGGTGGIPASLGGGTGEIPAPPESAEQKKDERPQSSAGQGETSEPPLKRIKHTDFVLVDQQIHDLRSFRHNAEGVAWEQIVSAFHAHCMEVQGSSEDPGIQLINDNEFEIQFNKSSIRGSYQLWTPTGGYKMHQNSVKVLDCNFRLYGTNFVDALYTFWNSYDYPGYLLKSLSRFFSGFLRHWGCKMKGGLPCDSGGWFPWELVLAMLTNALDPQYKICHQAE